jgi:hypothetical protein
MADLQIYQNRVNGGEISPQLEGRVDNERYNSGARLLENFIVKPNGSISKRPGTQYLATLPSASRLETYRASEESNYILAFTTSGCRAYDSNGAAVTVLSGDMLIAPVAYQASLASDTILYSTINNRYYKSYTTTSVDPATASSGYDEYTFLPGQVVLSGSNPGRAFKAIDTFNTYKPLSSLDYWIELTNIRNYTGLGSSQTSVATDAYYDDMWIPYTVDEFFDVQTTQINDLLFCVHKNHPPIVIARESAGNWKSYHTDFTFGPGDDYNTTDTTLKIVPYITEWDKDASVWGSSKLYYVDQYVKYNSNFYQVLQDHTSSTVPSSDTTNYKLLRYYVNDKIYNSYTDVYTCRTTHTPVTGTTSNEGEPGITTGALWTSNWTTGYADITYSNWSLCVIGPCLAYVVGDRVTNKGRNYECILNAGAGTVLREPGVGRDWLTYWKQIPLTNTSNGADEYYLQASNTMFTASSVGENIQLVINQTSNTGNINLGTLASNSVSSTNSLFFQGDYIVSTSWTVGNALSGGSTISILESLDNVNFQTIREYVFDADKVSNNISFTGQTPSVGSWYKVSVNKIGVGGQGQLTIEPTINNTTFDCNIVEYISPTKVKIKSKAGESTILPIKCWNVPTTVYKKSALSYEYGYPSTVAYHEQRLWFSGIPKFPGRIWGSAKNRLYDYRTGVLDTDAIDITIASKSTNQISWLQSMNRSLVVGTAGEIYTIDSGSNASNITPTSVRSQLKTSIGCSTIPGEVVGDSILYVQAGSNKLREFIYTDQSDAFIAPDLNIMADHIAEDKFIQTAYQSNLDQTLWAVNNNGALVGYTFDFVEGVGAWHRHFTGSRSDFYGVSGSPTAADNVNGNPDMFSSVATLNPAGDAICDQVWFVVKRWTNGQYKYFLERFDPTNMDFIFGGNESSVERWRFLDSYREYDMSSPDDTTTVDASPDYELFNNIFESHLYNDVNLYILSAGGSLWSDYYGTSNGRIRYQTTEIGGIQLLGSFNGTLPSSTNPDYTSGLLTGQFVVGLPIYSVYQPTRIDVNMGNGGSQGRLLRLNRFALRLWRSYGGKFNVYDPIQYSLSDAISAFEFRPVEGDTLTSVDYDKFTFNLSNQYPKIKTDSYYTGQTSDQHVNGNWSNNPIFTIVHDEPRPFNILGIIYKAEISSN